MAIEFDRFDGNGSQIEVIHCSLLHVDNKSIRSWTIDPQSRSISLNDLLEASTYSIKLSSIVREYVEQEKIVSIDKLPETLVESDLLSSIELIFSTCGFHVDQWLNVEFIDGRFVVRWKEVHTFGQTRLVKTEISIENTDKTYFRRLRVERADQTELSVDEYLPFGIYRFEIEFHLVEPISLDRTEDFASWNLFEHRIEKFVHRQFDLNFLDETLDLFLLGFSTDRIDLGWNRPRTSFTVKHPEFVDRCLHLEFDIIEFVVEIDRQQRQIIDKDELFCQLTSCRPGSTYSVELFARLQINSANSDDVPFDSTRLFELRSNIHSMRTADERGLFDCSVRWRTFVCVIKTLSNL